MKYLLDTGVFLWALAAPEKLNQKSREFIAREKQATYLSAVSSWEISVKVGIRKLNLPETPATYVPKRMMDWGIGRLDITHTHALAVADLPPHHQDPFDRMLIVQARMESMVLLTADPMIEKYDIETFWCGR